ncbi:hypothetical protein [Flagellimonas beolgyonensis]|nr:hypothetical protein [Allomuricauda beolgyonensis]
MMPVIQTNSFLYGIKRGIIADIPSLKVKCPMAVKINIQTKEILPARA